MNEFVEIGITFNNNLVHRSLLIKENYVVSMFSVISITKFLSKAKKKFS